MQPWDRQNSEDSLKNLMLALETASDLISEIRQASRDLHRLLDKKADLDTIITLLGQKKASVETLKELTREMKTQLRVDADGRVGVVLPESYKVGFIHLMADFRELLEEESRLEELICGRGFPIMRRMR